MKKFFAMFVALMIVTFAVVSATETNAKAKFEKQTAMSMAAAGMAVRMPAVRKSGSAIQRLRDKYGADRVVSGSYIRMEQYLTNGKSEYQFDHRKLGTEAITERKLNDQDAFYVTDIGIFLLQESTTIGGIGVLQTYPNPIQFPDEVGAVQNAHLEHIYNGYFAVKIGDTTWLPDQPVLNCRVVNTAQQSALATNDSERRPGDGFMPCEPAFTMKGRENNELKLIVPATSLQKVESLFGTSGYKLKVACVLFGYKITGAGNTN